MVKLIFFCRRRSNISHAEYVERLLDGHVPIALRHHPRLRRYTVNIVEDCIGDTAEYDSIGELSFDTMDDFEHRLYDSEKGRAAVERDVRAFMAAADAYATVEHVQKAALPTALGRRSEGVKLICPIQRPGGMTHAGFVAHWLQRHVPLALVHHPGLSRYVTNVVDRRLSDSGEEWDGIAELHFATEHDLQHRMYDSAAGERIIAADIERFIGRRAAYRVSEYVQKA